MKKLLFLFAATCLLMSCSSQDEMFNQNETINQESQALSNDLQSQILSNDQQSELTLRGLGLSEPYETLVNQFFVSTNQKPLYEYLAYSGAVHADQYVIDTYYSDENKGSSFYDQLSDRTFFLKGTLGKIGRSVPSSPDSRVVFYAKLLVYMPDMNCHKICNADIMSTHIYPGQLIKELGFTAHIPIYSLTDKSKFLDGEWGCLYQYYSSSKGNYRAFAEIYDLSTLGNGTPIWNAGGHSLGVIVLR